MDTFKGLSEDMFGINIKDDKDFVRFMSDLSDSFETGEFTTGQRKFARGKSKGFFQQSKPSLATDMAKVDQMWNDGEIDAEEYDRRIDAILSVSYTHLTLPTNREL